MSEFVPITITGIIEESVSQPRNDGTRGSALYNIPFRLSRHPPSEWAQHFPEAWNHPSISSLLHRPGICQVVGDTIWLNGTKMEEIEETHKATLQLALDETNTKYAEFDQSRKIAAEKRKQAEEAHRQSVKDAAGKIKF